MRRQATRKWIEVEPIGIPPLDQLHLPRPIPPLERFLPTDRFSDKRMRLKPDEDVGAVAGGEARMTD